MSLVLLLLLELLPLYVFVIITCCCCFSVTKSWLTLCDSVDCSNARLPCPLLSPSLLKLMPIELVMPSNHLIFCLPLLLPLIFSIIRIFSNELALHIRWPSYWSFSISPSNEHPGLVSFRVDWLDLCAVQGTLKSLLLHHSLKASVFGAQHSLMFNSYLYMTTGKTIALTLQTFDGKVMSPLFNTLSRFVIAILPRIRRI